MPELPEVQTIVDGLISKVIGKEISNLEEFRPGTIQYYTESGDSSGFGKVLKVERRGKYILIRTSKQLLLLVHLRMTGKLIFEKDLNNTSSHSRAKIIFSDKTKLIFDDVRTFGKIQIFHKNASIPALEKLGIEPLSKIFDESYLKNILSGKSAPIKNVLLNQAVVAGLGNIYVAEILFRAKIHPATSANKVRTADLNRIVTETKKVLQEAIKHNGTTISDYRSVEDKTGEFQNFLKVYGKKTCECGAEIKKIKQAGRSTYYCPECQK